MNKEDKYSLGYSIGKSIQENKDKIEKLEKQNIRFKKKNKQLKTQLDTANKKLDEIRKYCEQDSGYWGNDSYINGLNKGYKEAINDVLSIIGGE